MTKPTRYFLTGSAVVLLLGLGTGLIAYYKGDLPLFKSRVGPADLAYIPPDATGLAFANVHDFMTSDFHQKIREALPTGAGKTEFLNETGIDIERDIQSVLAATFPATPSAPADRGPGLVVIRGQFDASRIEALFRQHNGTVQDYKGHHVLAVSDQPADAGMSLGFLEPGVAVFGTVARVRSAIDAGASHQDVSSNVELMRLVAQLDAAGNTAWAVGNLDTVINNPNVPAQVKEKLPAVQWFAAGARVDSGITGQLRAEAKDDKSAADLRAVVNGAIAAGRLVGGNDAKVDAVLNSLQISGTGRDVELSFSVPPEMVDMLAGFATKGRRQDWSAKPATK